MTVQAVQERRFGGKTRAERQDERRTRLLRAAAAVYGERGYRNATVKAVCDAAGLTERYFYESFANSEDLLCACFQLGADLLLHQVRIASDIEGAAPLERARLGLLVYLGHLRAQPMMARVFLLEMSSVSARTDLLVSENLDRFGGLLVEILRARAPQAPDPLLIRGVIGGGLHVAQAWIASGYTDPADTVAATILRLYALVASDEQPER